MIGLVNMMEERIGSYHNEIFFISHGDCLEEANYLAQLIKERLGIAKTMISHIGPVIGSHAGPGALALSFLGENK